LRNKVEGALNDEFSSQEFVDIYTIIYKMCCQHDYTQQLYDEYRNTFEEYIALIVLPVLSKQRGEFKLREFEKRWENYKVMVGYMSNMFCYLDRYFVRGKSGVVLPPLREVGLMCFCELVCDIIRIDVNNSMFEIISREREGEQIYKSLLKHVVYSFVEIGMDYYKNHFEKAMFEDTATYYTRKAALWILEDSSLEYILKVEECLKNEEHKVAHYLHFSRKHNLSETVQYELFSRYETQLLAKQDSCWDVLLRDDKKDDVSRMYRLFCRIPKGLEPIASIFKQHVTSQGRALIKWAEDVVTNTRDVCGIKKHEFVQKVIEMYDKYMDYVKHAFHEGMMGSAHSTLLYAMQFEILCTK
jgi:cullin 1